MGRKVVSTGDVYELKGSEGTYSSDFDGKVSTLKQNNCLTWRVCEEISLG